MRQKIGVIAFLAVIGLSTMGQNQCQIEFPQPPFDVTGTYDGVWWGNTNDGVQEAVECPLTITLTQDASLPYPRDHAVQGTVYVDYSCIELPEWADEPEASEVPVAGLIGDDGVLTLLSGGCGIGFCVVLNLSGPGVNANTNGLMDAYSGDWSFTFLLAGVQPFGVTGGFEVEREK